MAAGKPKRKQKQKKGEGKSVRSTVTKGFWLTQPSRGTQQECCDVVVGRSHHKQNRGLRRTEGFVERRASKNGGLRNLVPKEVCCVGQRATKGVQRPTKGCCAGQHVLKRVQRPTKRLMRLSACCKRGPATHQKVLCWSANKGPATHKRCCVVSTHSKR